MKRFATFTARFALVPMISGPFVVSMTGRASLIEWAHIISGFATIYLIIGLVLTMASQRKFRGSVVIALIAALLEAVPGMPRLHAAISPLLFASLAWAVIVLPGEKETAARNSLKIFILPALVLLPIFYGVGYRHQTSGFMTHAGAALLAAGVIACCCMVLNERHASEPALRRAIHVTIFAVILQVALGFAAFTIRALDLEGGLLLAVTRTLHITGAALLLAACTELALRYRSPTVRPA